MGMKRRRARLLVEARNSLPDRGAGRLMHLVKAFEKLLTIPKSSNSEEKEDRELEETKKGLKWALPGLQKPTEFPESQPGTHLSGPEGIRTSDQWGANPRPDQKEENAKRKNLQQMMEEEENLRISIAQGLPWTTDEPECLMKPPVKDITRLVDLLLHSDIRAEERAGFDHQAEKSSSRRRHHHIRVSDLPSTYRQVFIPPPTNGTFSQVYGSSIVSGNPLQHSLGRSTSFLLKSPNLHVGSGADFTGVPTKMLNVNGSLRISMYNSATFYGIQVNSTPANLVYSNVVVATGQIFKYGARSNLVVLCNAVQVSLTL